jgi:hypothetical protein
MNRMIFPELESLSADVRELSTDEVKSLVFFMAKSCSKMLTLEITVN